MNPLIYTLLSIALGLILFKGRLPLFLHPKMAKYVWFLLVGTCGLSLYGWWGIIQALTHQSTFKMGFRWTHSAFLMLFMMVSLVNPQDINLSISENKASSFVINTAPQSVSIYNPNQDETGELVIPIEEEEDTSIEPNVLNPSLVDDGSSESPETTGEDKKVNDKDQKIGDDGSLENDSNNSQSDIVIPAAPPTANLNQDDFLDRIDSIGADPEAYIGQTITLEGFVYREKDFDDNAFVVGRLVISCCAADSTVGGIYVEGLDAAQFETESWVRVTGTIDQKSIYFKDLDMSMETAIIKATSIESIQPYDSPYVYMTY